MVGHAYGKRDRFQHTLLRMKAADLFKLSRDDRVSMLSEFCEGEELDEAVTDSYLRIQNFHNLPSAHLRILQRSLVSLGHEIGRTVVAQGDLASVHGAIQSSIHERIGERPKPAWHAVWHFVNVGLFLVWGLLSAAGDAAGFADLGFAIWLLSVSVMWAARCYGPAKWALEEKRRQYQEEYKFFEDAMSSGAEIELKAELAHREVEDLVTKQSWPGRGMTGTQSDSALGVDPAYARLRQAQGFSAVPARRSSAKPPRFTRNFQASDAKRAEELCAQWLRKRGDHTAATTKDGADGGVDIRSNKYVAQVKNYRGSVGVQPIREIYGIAAAEGKAALFFTSGTYTKAAIEFADSVKMPLITFDAALQKFSGTNLQGSMLT